MPTFDNSQEKTIDELPKANPSQIIISKKQFATTLAITGAIAGVMTYIISGKSPQKKLKKLQNEYSNLLQELNKAKNSNTNAENIIKGLEDRIAKLLKQISDLATNPKYSSETVEEKATKYRKIIANIENIYEDAQPPAMVEIKYPGYFTTKLPMRETSFQTTPKENATYIQSLLDSLKTKGKIEIQKTEKPLPVEEIQKASIEEFCDDIGKRQKRDITTTYGGVANWSNEKIARDILQNFYDANNHTLDGVGFLVEKTEAGKYRIKISGNGVFDYDKLKEFGNTSKTEDLYDAGGFGEGIKMVIASLFNKKHTDKINFACANWNYEYYPEGKHIYSHLTKNNSLLNGNYIEFETSNEGFAQQIIKAIDYFNHASNPDFQKLTFENDSFGFRILEPEQQKGNFYLTQRFEFGESGIWENGVDGLDIIFKRKPDPKTYEKITGHKLDTGRDRNYMSPKDIKELTRCFLKDLTDDDLFETLMATQKHWFSLEKNKDTGIKSFITAAIEEMSQRHIGLDLTNTKICFLDTNQDIVKKAVANAGYKIIPTSDCMFSNIGIPGAKSIFNALSNHTVLEKTPKEAKKLKILEEATGVIQRNFEKLYSEKLKNIFNNISYEDFNQEYIPFGAQHILRGLEDFNIDETIAKTFGSYSYFIRDKELMAKAIHEYFSEKISTINLTNINEPENQKIITTFIEILEQFEDKNEKLKANIIQLKNLEIINKSDVTAPRFIFDRTQEEASSTLGEAIINNREYQGHWIDKTYLNNGNFFDLLATWMHEICHKSGGDGTPEFTYKLTDMLEALLTTANSTEAQVDLLALQKVFNEI